MTPETLAKIVAAAKASPLRNVNWRNRGQAPIGYVAGMAAAYGVAFSALADFPALYAAIIGPVGGHKDSLAWYAEKFAEVPRVAAAPILRRGFVLLDGLGMRESSGAWNCGWDTETSDAERTADSAEAGLWQTSWDIHGASPLFADLLAGKYPHFGNDEDLLATFREGVGGGVGQNWGGVSSTGYRFQQLTKTRPLFAVFTALLGLRVDGGEKGHWGPIRNRAAEVRPEADSLFETVEAILASEGRNPAPRPPAEGPTASPTTPPATPAAPGSFKALRTGSTGERVVALQRLLQRAGAELQDDGDFGPITEQAVRRFQGAHALPVTGEVDEATATALAAVPAVVPAEPLPSVLRVAPHLATMRAITGTKELPGGADSPIIMSWRKIIADAFPAMAGYAATYTHDEIPWCGFGLGYCFAVNKLPPPFGKTDVERFMWAAAWGIDTPDLVVLPKGVFFPGAVMVFTRNGGGHVSIYEGEDDDYFHIRGCNQADMVNVTRFPKSQFTCASWPRSLPVPANNRVRMDAAHNPISTKVT